MDHGRLSLFQLYLHNVGDGADGGMLSRSIKNAAAPPEATLPNKAPKKIEAGKNDLMRNPPRPLVLFRNAGH
jgi:hypothetical protein